MTATLLLLFFLKITLLDRIFYRKEKTQFRFSKKKP